jgi:hypothetical protein
MATFGASITLNGYDYEEPEDYNRSVENDVPENLEHRTISWNQNWVHKSSEM